MVQISYYVRGDSSSANNAALNVEASNKYPTTLITFDSGATGDIKLDYNGGLPDPDTTVIVNGVSMTFTVEFSGTLPMSNKLSNIGGVDLRGKEIVVITLESGQRVFFLTDGSGTSGVMDAFPNGAHTIGNVTNTGPILICFAAGTLIATPVGERPVESLAAGDLVLNADGDAVPLLWIGHRRVSRRELSLHPELRPVRIPQDFFGPGLPQTPLLVSPQHRVLIDDWRAEILFGTESVLVPAIHLIGAAVRQVPADGPVDYYHLLFERHEVVLSNGLPTESLQPSAENLRDLSREALDLLDQSYPQGLPPAILARPAAARSLRAPESRALLDTALRRAA